MSLSMKVQLVFVSCLQLCNALSLHRASARGPKKDDTHLTELLNNNLEKGLVVRQPDRGTNAAHVPAVFWSNQIITPNSFFIWDRKSGLVKYQYPAVGFVVDPLKFNASDLWGDFGVTMYGHDANACDDNSEHGRGVGQYGRCTWLPSVGFDDGQHEYWDCPGGQVHDSDRKHTPFVKDVKAKGAGNYGCRGCSFSQKSNTLLDHGSAPLWANCQCPCTDYDSCNYFAKNDLRKLINEEPFGEEDGWFGYDRHSCWVKTPDAMAGIQNGLYQSRKTAIRMDGAEIAEKRYWGWNEVAVKREVNAPYYWLTHMIFIPAWLTAWTKSKGFDESTRNYLGRLIQDLVDNEEILPGKDQIGQKPGSDVVFVEEIRKGSGDEYKKRFFCMQQHLGKFTVCSMSQADDPNQQGYCYIADAATGCNAGGLQKKEALSDRIYAPKAPASQKQTKTQRSFTKTSRTNASERSVTSVCADKVPNDQRILLTSVAQAMHGTTALMTLLMSSNRLSTLCAGNTWQCEGYAIVEESGECDCRSVGKHGQCLEDYRCQRPVLDIFSEYWKLERPVLFDKEFAGDKYYSTLLSTAPLPQSMKHIGVARLERVHVVMWTPLCVRGLTGHRPLAPWSERRALAPVIEVNSLESLQAQHVTMVSKGVPVLVINYADLLWRPDATIQRLLKFMPCLGKLDADFYPKSNVHVLPGNKFKVTDGIRDFGMHHSATSCGYDVVTRKCSNQTLYHQLSPALRLRLARAEAYFEELSI